MTGVTEVHEEKLTLTVDVNIPGHDPRTTTPLFLHTRQELIRREGGRCWICQRTAGEVGQPLEAHHYPIERSLAEMIDFERVKKDYPRFNWHDFDPANPYTFVDDMTVNGLLVCKDHHIGKNQGIHALPHPLWVAQRYGKEGYQFSAAEVIHHDQEPAHEGQ